MLDGSGNQTTSYSVTGLLKLVSISSEIGRASCRGKSVDLGGRRIIKKKNKKRQNSYAMKK